MRVPAEEFALFNAELAALVGCGLPLERAIAALARDMRRGRLRTAAEGLTRELEAGTSFPDAVRARRDAFPPLYGAMLEAGIAAGDLRGALAAVAEGASRAVRVRRQILRAIGYPVSVMVMMLLALTAYSYIYMRPLQAEMANLYEDVGIGLPAATQFALVVTKYAWIWLGALSGLVIVVTLLLAAWRLTAAGRAALDRAAMRLPILRGFLKSAFWARFCRTVAGLLRVGVPVDRALRVARELAGNTELVEEVGAAARDVESGMTLSDALAQRRQFPHILVWTVSIAEKRGDLPEALRGMGDLFAEDLDRRTTVWVAILGPSLIVLTAACMAGLGILMLMPLFNMVQGIV